MTVETRVSTSSPEDIKSGDPKPFTYRVFVDPAKSIEELCKEAGVEIIPALLDGEGKLKGLREWPEEPFNFDDRKKPKPNGTVMPYTVELTNVVVNDKGEQSTTAGVTWEKAKKAKTKGQSLPTANEVLELIRGHPELLDGQRLVASKTTVGIYEVVQIEKVAGKITLSPLFVGDTNTDGETFDPKKEKEKGKGYSVNGVTIKEGKVATRLPFAIVLAKGRQPQIPSA